MRRVILAMLCVTLIEGWGYAQAEDSWGNLKQLRLGQKIEVADMKLRSRKGTFIALTEEAIVLKTEKREVSLPRSDVFRVTSREGSRRGRNALIGLGVGAGFGALIGFGLDSRYGDQGEYIATGLFGVVGAGVGAGIGAAFPGYRTIYRAKKPR